ncbi:hypothetical protein Agub_g15288 [Astrephomene gubernaculifera]|uniref:NIF system FeS cluster assembly NifU C-terminal domain-containing protein n=1 Tax=Astrephomene gubernaculifera TaxID=47775 RepID=A0AAD3E2X2_9CHLO|nr:hypothetical protein Agub_g15288 [Astrephomene gubernaculifera]
MNRTLSPRIVDSCTPTAFTSAATKRLRFTAFLPVRNVTLAAISKQAAVFAVSVVDNNSVPEAHKGLHGFLYGEGGAEEHDQGKSYTVRKEEDEGGLLVPVPAYLESRDGEKPLGVYCLYDKDLAPQYIGYSRNMVLAIKGHLARVGPDLCAHVRVMVYGNRAMASRANLERGVANWVSELMGGVAPPGNTQPQLRAAWEGVSSEGGAGAEGAEGGVGPEGGVSPSLAGPAVLDRRLMSAGELAAYEEKRLKLRKAMGEKLAEVPGGSGSSAPQPEQQQQQEEEEDDLATRRLKLMRAMDRGDWSAVIHAQTQEALGAAAAAAAGGSSGETEGAASGGGGGGGEDNASSGGSGGEAGSSSNTGGGESGIVSPFEAGGAASAAAAAAAGGSSGSSSAGKPARQQQQQQQPLLTVEAVQTALEEVRPYLLADGGDVEVVEVREGTVYLRLQGACSTCPSQSATMKGGIERVIMQTFGGQVRDIVQLGAAEPSGATPDRVDAALNMLRGAISNLGGSVEVLGVEGGVCTLRYRGPPAIGKGVQGAVRDTFKDLREVRLVD